MANYHCPQCQKELKKGDYAPWVKWCIGPIFGEMLKPLICDQHGEIDIKSLSPEERGRANTVRLIGIVVGGILNIIILAFILMYSLDK